MEHDSIDLDDPVAAKLRDSAMLDRLVRQAVAEAVEKAGKLGFLIDDDKRSPDGVQRNPGQ